MGRSLARVCGTTNVFSLSTCREVERAKQGKVPIGVFLVLNRIKMNKCRINCQAYLTNISVVNFKYGDVYTHTYIHIFTWQLGMSHHVTKQRVTLRFISERSQSLHKYIYLYILYKRAIANCHTIFISLSSASSSSSSPCSFVFLTTSSTSMSMSRGRVGDQ